MPNSPTRNPVFWLVFGVLGLGGAWTALQLFTVAMPNVSLEISMDREGALAAAEQLATSRGWGPAPARSAASFGQVDPEPQTYVELEGGGREAFQSLIDAGVFAPWQWRVRRFAEGEVQETEVRFAPDGEPYGFRLRLAEDDPGGGNVDRDAARTLAEREARAWPVDLDAYDLSRIGPLLEHHPIFLEGANISLAKVESPTRTRIRTWERGAGLTKACGTAACATLVSAARKQLMQRAGDIIVPGGRLHIEWRADDHVIMTGPAEVEYDGTITFDSSGGMSVA